MSDVNQEKKTALARLFNREQIMTKEMKNLTKKGYIDTFTADKVIRGYQTYTQDQLSEIHKDEVQSKEPFPSLIPQKNKAAPLRSSDEEPRIHKKTHPQAPEKKVRSADQLRERHLQLILIAGVALLFLAGAVLATTSWLLLSPIIKVSLISLIAVVFLGMAKLASILKIPQTSQAFLILSCLFFPFPFLSGSYYHLFGSYLSLDGTGRFLFGFLLTASFAIIYGLIGHKKKLRLMTQLSIGLGYISLLFLIRQMIPTQDIRSIMTLVLLLIFNARGAVFYQRFYKSLEVKQWQRYLGIINCLTVLATLPTFKLTIMGIVLIGLLASLSLQIGYQSETKRLKWWKLSASLIALMFIIGTSFVGIFTLTAGLVSSVLLLLYTLLRQFWQRQLPSTTFDKLDVSYNRELTGLFILSIASHLILNFLGISSLINLLASALVLGTISLNNQQKTIKTMINFGFLSFILLIELVAISPLESLWQLRLLLSVGLVLYNGVIRKEPLTNFSTYLTKITLSIYSFLWAFGWLLLSDITMFELSSWSLLLLGSLYHVCLVSPSANRRLSPLLPIGLVLSLIPIGLEGTTLPWTAFLVSLAVLISGHLFKKWLAPSFIRASHGLSLILYGISLVSMLTTSFLSDTALTDTIILLFGSYLMYACGRWLKQPLFFNGVPLMFFWSLLSLLNLLNSGDLALLVSYEALLAFSYGLIIYKKQKNLNFLGEIGLAISLLGFWLLSLAQVGKMSDLSPSFMGLFLPMAIIGSLYLNLQNNWLKRSALLVECYLVIGLLKLSFNQLLAINLEIHWLFLILTTLLTLGMFLKDQQKIILPIGLLHVGFSLFLFLSASYAQLIGDLPVIAGSSLLLVYGIVYLIPSPISQVPQLSILVSLCYFLCLFPSRESVSTWLVSSIVWGLLVISYSLTVWKKHSLILAKNRPNLMIAVQLIGITGLLFLETNTLWIKLYLLVLSLTLSYLEPYQVVKRSLLNLATILSFLLIYDGLMAYLLPHNMPLTKLLISLTSLVTLTGSLRFIWQQHRLAKIMEWVISGLILFGYLITSLSGNLTDSLYGASFALLLVIVAYLTKYTAYFTNGLVYLVLFILYSQRHFWAAIPWWLYLALAGILLIALGSLSEWRRRNQAGGLVRVRAKIKNYFKDWQ